jgi:hypothetical protein
VNKWQPTNEDKKTQKAEAENPHERRREAELDVNRGLLPHDIS